MKKKSTSKDLYVANIAFETEEEDLQKLFAICGTVRGIHMVTDSKSCIFKGFAFVHMITAAEAQEAIKTLDEVVLHNRYLSVTEALPRKTAVAPAAAAAKDDGGKAKRSKRPPRTRK